jgi:hypothetical protein
MQQERTVVVHLIHAFHGCQHGRGQALTCNPINSYNPHNHFTLVTIIIITRHRVEKTTALQRDIPTVYLIFILLHHAALVTTSQAIPTATRPHQKDFQHRAQPEQ